ncbi:MAG: hypothetical protein WCV85_04795 [Patescibacteria group bacterium]|jgi:multiple sugar transport system substrate-binding protein
MDDFKKRMVLLGGLLGLVIVLIIGYQIFQRSRTGAVDCSSSPVKRVELSWWGHLGEDQAQAFINAYTSRRPYVTITYRKLSETDSDQQLIEAWARGTGPDIYSVKNEQLRYFTASGLVTPMPATTTSYTYTVKKVWGIKEELSVCKQTKPLPTLESLKSTFVAGAVEDMAKNGQIVGYPLNFDSVAMFYNQKMLDDAGILTPPRTWVDFAEKVVPKLTLEDASGNLTRSGAAMGRGTNVLRNPEIVAGLLQQYNVPLTDATGTQVAFGSGTNAQAVLTLAASFGMPTKRNYSWNATFPESLEALAQGKAAVAFGTREDYQKVVNQTTGTDIRVAPFPQAAANGTTYVANYWLETVARAAKDPNVAWDFLRTIADPTQAKIITDTDTPAARTLVQTARGTEEENLSIAQVFARQAATAKPWYTGVNATKGREALNTLIDTIGDQKEPIAQAIERAQALFQISLRIPGR